MGAPEIKREYTRNAAEMGKLEVCNRTLPEVSAMLIRLIAVMLFSASLILAGCSRDDAEEAYEDAQDAVEEAAEDTTDAYDDLGDEEDGDTMRERIGDAYDSAQESASTIWAEAVAATQGALHASQEGLEQAREGGEEAWEEAMAHAEEAREEAREAVERAREEGGEASDDWQARAQSVWEDAEEAWEDLRNWDPSDVVEDDEEEEQEGSS